MLSVSEASQIPRAVMSLRFFAGHFDLKEKLSAVEKAQLREMSHEGQL
jgi:hypothetical protein